MRGWAGVGECLVVPRVSGSTSGTSGTSDVWDYLGYLGVPRGTSGDLGVPRGTSAYLGVPRGTSGYLGGPRESRVRRKRGARRRVTQSSPGPQPGEGVGRRQ